MTETRVTKQDFVRGDKPWTVTDVHGNTDVGKHNILFIRDPDKPDDPPTDLVEFQFGPDHSPVQFGDGHWNKHVGLDGPEPQIRLGRFQRNFITADVRWFNNPKDPPPRCIGQLIITRPSPGKLHFRVRPDEVSIQQQAGEFDATDD